MLYTLLTCCGCISFDSYIKPQHVKTAVTNSVRCISFDSYIKPQPKPLSVGKLPVVYLLIPTSNHNVAAVQARTAEVVYLLIPTSNHNVAAVQARTAELYIFWFLHQTTTSERSVSEHHLLYIFWFLHQTTTVLSNNNLFFCCISFDSYIKPQLKGDLDLPWYVVYLLIPTSNHNFNVCHPPSARLYIFWFLHQTTTRWVVLAKHIWLYIFWFLHQTTTRTRNVTPPTGCISFDSYIKPQRYINMSVLDIVVYLLIPTSNHNVAAVQARTAEVVYLLIPTSNHN